MDANIHYLHLVTSLIGTHFLQIVSLSAFEMLEVI